MKSKPVHYPRGRELFHEDQPSKKVFVVEAGWASSFKDLDNGVRQVINFAIPGDCVGFRGILLQKSDHAFSALTDAEISSIDIGPMTEMFDDFPNIRTAFLWCAARDQAMALDHLVSLGRRDALDRTAHFFLELAERLMLVGLGTEKEFRCPLNQYELADALGLSAIHVNRVLRVLRDRQLLTFRAGGVIIHDLDELAEIAGYVFEANSQRSVLNLGWCEN